MQVMRLALQEASMQPQELGVLELHGTGTPLGDPIELGAAAAVLAGSSRSSPLGLSAAKSYLGHTEPAAGAASMHRSIIRCRLLPLLTHPHGCAMLPVVSRSPG